MDYLDKKLGGSGNLDIGLLILRLGIGGMMLTHGIPKLMNFAEMSTKFADPFGLGPEISLGLVVFAEVFCAILLMVGFKTRWVAIPLLITMLVAAFMIHGADPFGKKEKALLYAVALVPLLLSGGGRLAIDAMRRTDQS